MVHVLWEQTQGCRNRWAKGPGPPIIFQHVVYNLLSWSRWTVAALYNDYPFEREFNLFRFVSSISSGVHNLSISLCCATCDRESPTNVSHVITERHFLRECIVHIHCSIC